MSSSDAEEAALWLFERLQSELAALEYVPTLLMISERGDARRETFGRRPIACGTGSNPHCNYIVAPALLVQRASAFISHQPSA